MKVGKRYHEEDHYAAIMTIDQLREVYTKRGEDAGWINFVISQLESGIPVSTRFAELIPINEN